MDCAGKSEIDCSCLLLRSVLVLCLDSGVHDGRVGCAMCRPGKAISDPVHKSGFATSKYCVGISISLAMNEVYRWPDYNARADGFCFVSRAGRTWRMSVAHVL